MIPLNIISADTFEVDQLVRAVFLNLLSVDSRSLQRCKSLLAKLSVHEQKTLLYSIIRILSKQHLRNDFPSQYPNREGQSKTIGGVGSLLRAIVGSVPNLLENLVEWLVGVSADAVGQLHNAHRAVIVALSSIPGLYKESALQCVHPLKHLQNKPPKHWRKA